MNLNSMEQSNSLRKTWYNGFLDTIAKEPLLPIHYIITKTAKEIIRISREQHNTMSKYCQ